MSQSWMDSLQPASFRGVGFGVRAATDTVGRKTVVHSYPQRKDPYVEDMGEADRPIRVTGFLVGHDYMARRDALEKTFLTPGAGTLVHPWYGSVTVALTAPVSINHSADAGGMCSFGAEFIRVEAANTPTATPNAGIITHERAEACRDILGARLQSSIRLGGLGEFVLSRTTAEVQSSIRAVESILGVNPASVASWVADLANTATASQSLYSMVTGGSFGSAYVSMVRDSAASLPDMAQGRDPHQLLALSASAAGYPDAPVNAGIARRTAHDNDMAMLRGQRQAALVESAALAAEWQPETREDGMRLRANLVKAFEDALLGVDDQEAFAALVDLRTSAIRALAKNTGQAPETGYVREVSVRPSLAVTHRWTGTLAVEESVILRNKVPHPGFMPGGQDLEVILRAAR